MTPRAETPEWACRLNPDGTPHEFPPTTFPDAALTTCVRYVKVYDASGRPWQLDVDSHDLLNHAEPIAQVVTW